MSEEAWWFNGVCYGDDRDEMIRVMMENIRKERTMDMIETYLENTGEWNVSLVLLNMIGAHKTPEEFFKELTEEVVSWVRSLSSRDQVEFCSMFGADRTDADDDSDRGYEAKRDKERFDD